MSINIQGKVALVTGANRGIGKATVESFLKHGASKVYLAVRNLDSVSQLVKSHGEKVQALHIDLEKPETIKSAAETANDVQVVVSNAGVLRTADTLSDDAEEAFNYELNINTFGLIRMAKAFIPVLEKNGGGAFVQLNSVASIKNFFGFSTYSASKAAAYSLTQGLRDSVAGKGINILSVHPGPIATDMAHDAGFTDQAEPVSSVSEGIVKALKSGDFHLFPDATSENFLAAYQGYSEAFIEAEAS